MCILKFLTRRFLTLKLRPGACALRTFATALLISGPVLAGLQPFRSYEHAVQIPYGVEISFAGGGKARVEMLAPDVARVRVTTRESFSVFASGAVARAGLLADPRVSFLQDGAGVYLTTQSVTVAIFREPFRISVLRRDGTVVTTDVPEGIAFDRHTGLILNAKQAFEGEAFFGLGARGGPINRRGRGFVMHNVDRDAYSEFSDPLYLSMPFYYGLLDGRAYGIFLDNPADPFFDMDSRQRGTVTFGAMAEDLDYYVFSGPEPAQVAHRYAQLTGATPLPPKWALGYHQSRYGYKSQSELLALAREFRTRRIPLDVLWLDIDYMDRFRALTWNQAAFPNPRSMNDQLGALGIKTVNINEPLLLTDDPMWQEASAGDHLLKNRDGTTNVSTIWLGDISFVDFTKFTARNWFKAKLKKFLADGMSGLWNDLNEPAQNYMPQVSYDFNGLNVPDLLGRNVYALHHASLTHEAMVEARPESRPWIISRSGYPGIQRFSANWSGDTLSSFESLRVSVQMTISMGLSGQNFFGHDIGGFLGSPSAELFTRWLQFGCYIPLFRNHATDTTDPREPWVFGEPHTSASREIINQRYRMMPYLYTLFQQSVLTGAPVVAPLFFYFPGDAGTYDQDQSFLLGPELLVAPITGEGMTSREVYLPRGVRWIDFYTNQIHEGGMSVTVQAPIERIPIFVREGAILPAGPVVQSTQETARHLTLTFYPGPARTTQVYDDDGATIRYLATEFSLLNVSRAEQGTATTVTLSHSGKRTTLADSALTLEFLGVINGPSTVLADAANLAQAAGEEAFEKAPSGWIYRRTDRKLLVKLPNAKIAVVRVQ